MKRNQFIAFIATSMMALTFSMPANAQFGNQQRPTQQGQERRVFHHRGISLFSFSDKKIKALQMMASHIVDPQNAADIYKQFTFSSDKDKAAEIIRYSGK